MTSLVRKIDRPSNQGMDDILTIEVVEKSPDVRSVQITLSINCHQYIITSNAVDTSIKGAEIAVELLELLWKK